MTVSSPQEEPRPRPPRLPPFEAFDFRACELPGSWFQHHWEPLAALALHLRPSVLIAAQVVNSPVPPALSVVSQFSSFTMMSAGAQIIIRWTAIENVLEARGYSGLHSVRLEERLQRAAMCGALFDPARLARQPYIYIGVEVGGARSREAILVSATMMAGGQTRTGGLRGQGGVL
jgi:hypothetical protein